MKHFFSGQFTMLLYITTVLSFSSCSKKSNPSPTAPATITSLSVDTGVYGTTVKIYGTGFSSTPSDDKVFFNGKAAAVTAATTSQLTVTVPVGAGTGKVSLSVNNGTAVSGLIFNYQYTYTSVLLAGNPSQVGDANGVGANALLNGIGGIAIDSAGNMYLPEQFSQLIKKITPQGMVSSYAGLSSVSPTLNGTFSAVMFDSPVASAVDASGNLYVADETKSVQKITATGSSMLLDANHGPTTAFFEGLAVDAGGNVYITDNRNNNIQKITPGGLISTFAGNGQPNSVDGTRLSASFESPFSIAIDHDGNLYVTDKYSYKVRKITPNAVVSTLCSNAFGICGGIAVDYAENVYITSSHGNFGEIDKINPDGKESTLASGLPLPLGGIAIDKNNNIFFLGRGAIYQLTYK